MKEWTSLKLAERIPVGMLGVGGQSLPPTPKKKQIFPTRET